VNYFDTAVQYGNGQSEKNLSRILQNLKPTNNPSAATEVWSKRMAKV
jgi:aryl-alcohol dehydrogenase-like predicted oxidoreductase